MSMLRRIVRGERQLPEIPRDINPTPIYITPRIRLILIIATFVLIYLLASAAPSIPRLLMLGATLALVLSFPVRMLSRWIPRGWAIAVAVGTTLLFVLLLLIILVPFIISEVSDFIQEVPEIAEDAQDLTRDAVIAMNQRGWIRQNPDEVYETIETTLLNRGQSLIETGLATALNTLTRSINVLISAFGVFFIATYLLIDMPRFRQTFVNSFSTPYRRDAQHLWETLGESLSRYLGGLLVSITLQGILAGIGLWFLDIPFAALLGIWMAITAILPYIGAFLGAIPAVIIAFTLSWQHALVTVLLYVVINQTEANFITPRIQGNAVRVHPLLIFLAVLLGSELGGAFGAIIAVPTLAVMRVLAEFFWVRLRVRGTQDTLLSAIGGDSVPETGPMLAVEADEPEPSSDPVAYGPERPDPR
ncbi:MAG TPA: AI-2E family transporter [Thermomicrobiales bacterium]|nr:AI-2E family transporter [Thermomicrobiales bacterium]